MTTVVDLARSVGERPATAFDEAFFRELFVADRLPEFLAVLPRDRAEAMVADQFRLQTVGYAEQYPNASRRVVLWRDQPVGRVIDADQGDRLRVVDLLVHPSWHGRGIGTEVVSRVQARARAAGQQVWLCAFIGSPAQQLYESLGFRPVGEDGTRVELRWAP